MRKITIKDVVGFRKKTDFSKKSFAKGLKIEKPKTSGSSGGDYWVTSVSAVSKSFKESDFKNVAAKIDELNEKYSEVEDERTKSMYMRNITILRNYVDYDIKKWKPSGKTLLLPKGKYGLELTIKSFQIQVKPQHIFSFKKADINEVGAIWFVANLNGYKLEELGMFVEVLHEYLKTYYSKEYVVNPKYCIAVDLNNNVSLSYAQLEKGDAPSILNSTLDEIRKLI